MIWTAVNPIPRILGPVKSSIAVGCRIYSATEQALFSKSPIINVRNPGEVNVSDPQLNSDKAIEIVIERVIPGLILDENDESTRRNSQTMSSENDDNENDVRRDSKLTDYTDIEDLKINHKLYNDNKPYEHVNETNEKDSSYAKLSNKDCVNEGVHVEFTYEDYKAKGDFKLSEDGLRAFKLENDDNYKESDAKRDFDDTNGAYTEIASLLDAQNILRDVKSKPCGLGYSLYSS